MHQYFEETAEYIINDIQKGYCPVDKLHDNLEELKKNVLKTVISKYETAAEGIADLYITNSQGDYSKAQAVLSQEYKELIEAEKNEIRKDNIRYQMILAMSNIKIKEAGHKISTGEIKPALPYLQKEEVVNRKYNPVFIKSLKIVASAFTILLFFYFLNELSDFNQDDDRKYAFITHHYDSITESLSMLSTITLIGVTIFISALIWKKKGEKLL